MNRCNQRQNLLGSIVFDKTLGQIVGQFAMFEVG